MKLALIKKIQETSDVISFIWQPAQPINWQAGQFLQYTLGSEKKYFTIASAPFEQGIRLTTRFSDPGSDFKKALKNMPIGQTIEATDPHGSFTLEDPSKNYVFLAGGIGITPFRAILLDLAHRHQPINITLLYANRDQNIVFKEELEKLLPVHYFIDPDRIDEKAILSTVYRLPSTVYYISGPEFFVLNMERLLSNLGVPPENIKRDYFPGYDKI